MEKFKHICFLHMQRLTNFPFIEADFDALTNYELLCKVVEYLNKVIANENEQNESINELADAFNSLKSYVDNYFDNLDVQEEINNKLDEMVEDGTLDQIIEQYLNSSAIWGFNTVADMKEATNLINGSYAKTYGFYSYDDKGGALYKIRTITNDDVVDEMTIIALHDDSLIAELVLENEIVYVDKLGAKGDGTTDDYNVFVTAIKLAQKIKGYIQLSNKSYFIGSTIDLSSTSLDYGFLLDIRGISRYRSKLIFDKDLSYGIKYTGETFLNFRIENIWFAPNTIFPAQSNINLLYLLNSPYSIFKSIRLDCSNYGLYQNNCWCGIYEDITCRHNNYGIYINGIKDGIVGNGDFLRFENLYLGDANVNAGLYLNGCVDVLINNLDAEASNQGPALLINECKNVTVNEIYIEYFQNIQPIKITCEDFTKLANIPTNLVFNNINVYNSVSPFRIEAGLNIEINNLFYRNGAYNENPNYSEHPTPCSIKTDNGAYIGTISINGNNYIRPVSSGTALSPYIAYNDLIIIPASSQLNYYKKTFSRGQKIDFPNDNYLYIITDDGSYGSAPTATLTCSANSYVATLSEDDPNIFTGQFITVDSKKYRVIVKNGTSITVDTKFTSAYTDESITVCNPTFIKIDHAQ